MDLIDLYKKHQQNIEEFEALRQKVWDSLKEKQNRTIAAFGSRDNLPEDSRKQMDKELKDFHDDWANDTGKKYQDMVEQHKRQISEQTIKHENKDNSKQSQNRNQQENQQTKEQTKQKLISEQKAMFAKMKKQQRPKR